MLGRRVPATTIAPAVAALALLLAGCGTTLTPQEMARSCSGLAATVSKAGLSGGTPTQAEAKSVADALDPILPGLRDPRVHDAGVALHTHLHGVEVALGKGDPAKADVLAGRAREAVEKAAQACGIPQSAFLGG